MADIRVYYVAARDAVTAVSIAWQEFTGIRDGLGDIEGWLAYHRDDIAPRWRAMPLFEITIDVNVERRATADSIVKVTIKRLET